MYPLCAFSQGEAFIHLLRTLQAANALKNKEAAAAAAAGNRKRAVGQNGLESSSSSSSSCKAPSFPSPPTPIEVAAQDMKLRQCTWGAKLGFGDPSAKPFQGSKTAADEGLSSGWQGIDGYEGLWPSQRQLENGAGSSSGISNSSSSSSSSSCHLKGARGAVAEGIGEGGSGEGRFSRYVTVPALPEKLEMLRQSGWLGAFAIPSAPKQRGDFAKDILVVQGGWVHTSLTDQRQDDMWKRAAKAREEMERAAAGAGTAEQGQNSSIVKAISLEEEAKRRGAFLRGHRHMVHTNQLDGLKR